MYDIAIVGAGPAGATLARELGVKERNLKILIIDGLAEGGDKVCGGLLSPDAQEVLSSFGLSLPSDILTSPQATLVDTIDLGAKIRRGYKRDYINMDRSKFDRWLLSLVPSGVDITVGRCLKAEKRNGNFALTVKTKDAILTVEAKLLVGADGAASIVRKTFFPERKIYKYVSIQEWYKSDDHSLPDYSCVYDKETSDSCSWTIRKDGYYIFGGAFPKKNCREAFALQKSRLEDFLGVSFGEAVKREACLVCSPRRMGDFVTGENGVFLVGEAAGFISASSFEGISSAMISGKLLAEAVSDGKTAEKIAKIYKSKMGKLKLKMFLKIPKMKLLTSPQTRKIIMKSGITAIKK